jgi:hypothetical protein
VAEDSILGWLLLMTVPFALLLGIGFTVYLLNYSGLGHSRWFFKLYGADSWTYFVLDLQ